MHTEVNTERRSVAENSRGQHSISSRSMEKQDVQGLIATREHVRAHQGHYMDTLSLCTYTWDGQDNCDQVSPSTLTYVPLRSNTAMEYVGDEDLVFCVDVCHLPERNKSLIGKLGNRLRRMLNFILNFQYNVLYDSVSYTPGIVYIGHDIRMA